MALRHRDTILLAASALVGAGLVALAATVAIDAPAPMGHPTVYFTPFESDRLELTTIDDPRPPLTERQARNLELTLVEFAKNADVLLRRDLPDSRLDQLEAIFIQSGHYLDLVAIYQNLVETQGVDTVAAPRLAWALMRLGQHPQARQLLDQIIAERPDDAMTWFLEGVWWLPESTASDEAAARAVAAWRRALALDPNFKGFEGLDAEALRQQVSALAGRTGPEKIADATAELKASTGPVSAAAFQIRRALGVALDAAEDARPAEPPAPQPEAAARPAPQQAPPGAEKAPPAAAAQPSADALLARAEIALAGGEAERAERLFKQVQAQRPNSAAAALGVIRAGWRDEQRRHELAVAARKLAERGDLSPRLRYELGRFALRKMGARELALAQLEAVRQADPQLADRLGVDRLIEQARR